QIRRRLCWCWPSESWNPAWVYRRRSRFAMIVGATFSVTSRVSFPCLCRGQRRDNSASSGKLICSVFVTKRILSVYSAEFMIETDEIVPDFRAQSLSARIKGERMVDPLILTGVFMLGASAGALLSHVRHRSLLNRLEQLLQGVYDTCMDSGIAEVNGAHRRPTSLA